MNKITTIFLQVTVVLIGVAALAFLLMEPHFEGRNVDASVFEIYFMDPFLAFAYIASIPFFVGVYKVFKVLGYAGEGKRLSETALKTWRTIKYCGLSIVGFVLVGEIFIMMNESDDRSGGVFMGLLVIFGASLTAAIAARFEKAIKNSRV